MNNIMFKHKVEGRKPVWVIGAETLMIDLYREQEHLWNFRHKDYYDRNLRENSLLQMSRQLGHDYRGVPYSPREIKEKLKNMRATFGRELKKQCNPKRNSNGTYRPGWKHYNRMQFLRVARVPRKKKDMDKTTTDQELEYEECILEDDDEHLDMYCEVEMDQQDETSETQMVETTEEDAKALESTTTMKTEPSALTEEEEAVEPTTRSQEFKVVRKGSCFSFEPNKRLRKVITSLANTSATVTTDKDNNANFHLKKALGSSSVNIDGEFHFCMSLAENLRRMNAFNREMAKVEIQKVMIKFMFPYADTEPTS